MRRSVRRVAAALFSLACLATIPTVLETTPAQGRAPAEPVPLNCGASYAKPGGGQYQCTFVDDFKGTALNSSNWAVQTTAASGFHPGPECIVNNKNNVKVAGGYLNLTARRESKPFTCVSPTGNFTTQYTGGTITTWGKFAQAYGRFEVRAKFPAAIAAGLQESLWMVPQKPRYGEWPQSGEIDIAEHFSIYPAHAAPYVHYLASQPDPNVTSATCKITEGVFHSYVLEWTPSWIKISFDGTVCITDVWTPAAPLVMPQPFEQRFVVALTQSLGIGANRPTAATPLPATTQVDYVKVWA